MLSRPPLSRAPRSWWSTHPLPLTAAVSAAIRSPMNDPEESMPPRTLRPRPGQRQIRQQRRIQRDTDRFNYNGSATDRPPPSRIWTRTPSPTRARPPARPQQDLIAIASLPVLIVAQPSRRKMSRNSCLPESVRAGTHPHRRLGCGRSPRCATGPHTRRCPPGQRARPAAPHRCDVDFADEVRLREETACPVTVTITGSGSGVSGPRCGLRVLAVHLPYRLRAARARCRWAWIAAFYRERFRARGGPSSPCSGR